MEDWPAFQDSDSPAEPAAGAERWSLHYKQCASLYCGVADWLVPAANRMHAMVIRLSPGRGWLRSCVPVCVYSIHTCIHAYIHIYTHTYKKSCPYLPPAPVPVPVPEPVPAPVPVRTDLCCTKHRPASCSSCPSSRLRAYLSCAEHIASHGSQWHRQTDMLVVCAGRSDLHASGRLPSKWHENDAPTLKPLAIAPPLSNRTR